MTISWLRRRYKGVPSVGAHRWTFLLALGLCETTGGQVERCQSHQAEEQSRG